MQSTPSPSHIPSTPRGVWAKPTIDQVVPRRKKLKKKGLEMHKGG